MAHNGSHGAVAGSDMSEQKERSSVGMVNRGDGKTPGSKSKGRQFSGYGSDDPLQTSEPKQQERRGLPGQKGPKEEPFHPWLEFPPNFERSVARKVVILKRIPGKLFEPVPAELRYSLSRNFGFFTSIFTQFFDKSGVSNVKNSIGLGKP
mmetsp:Transcript_1758/g.3995  ORF Transcript_1758/g.3995 Transcript_1758/m.3995 type:complete len:150 (-) Transcript_1758:67-516(-)|eukprot:CAMPEP_0181363890 /NCGR_PEP_ID=MMETSP1106-20121128/9029_1 /TAXON_ID=81844 /ORGANISM="Mantoniella antarctica, Strain SL-175" /LENGTH=149 /DNA_ID=CAMNT_0023478437 /DNA_START=271 /DNA_END=720 /DNA_ORIENTATION=+